MTKTKENHNNNLYKSSKPQTNAKSIKIQQLIMLGLEVGCRWAHTLARAHTHIQTHTHTHLQGCLARPPRVTAVFAEVLGPHCPDTRACALWHTHTHPRRTLPQAHARTRTHTLAHTRVQAKNSEQHTKYGTWAYGPPGRINNWVGLKGNKPTTLKPILVPNP